MKNLERNAEILRQWADHRSASAIGIALRVTRNVVTGVVCRAGKQRREPRPVRQQEDGRRSVARMRPRLVAIAGTIDARHREQVALIEEIPPMSDQDIPAEQRRTILSIRDGECRWPIAGEGVAMELCGARTDAGRPFCGVHARIAYSSPGHRDGGFRPTYGRMHFLMTERV